MLKRMMRRAKVKIFIKYTCLIITAIYFLLPGITSAEQGEWWNDSWEYRKKISFDSTPSGADIKENLNDFPLLVRLHSGNFNFTNAKDDGSDIRFISSDGTNLLKYHIERFDPIDEMALIWVKIPRISAGTATEYIWMYYGNEDAAGGQDINGTYAVDQILVMHLDEIEGQPKDATAYKNNASEFKGGQGLPSIIGTGVTFTGTEDVISITNSPSMDFSKGFTFSAWVRITEAITDADLFYMAGDKGEIKIGIENSMIYCSVTSDTGVVTSTEKSTGIAPMTWKHLCVTVMPNGRITIYDDGIEATWTDMDYSIPALNSNTAIGNSIERSKPLLADLDEIRVSNSVKSKSYIRLSYFTEGPESPFLVVEGEQINEGGGGLPVFYLATVVKNISLDGWVIIILLALFAILSWIIVLSKGFQIMYIEKENRLFLESFSNNSDLLGMNNEEAGFDNSPICRLYKSGCKGLKGFLGRLSSENKTLTQKDTNTVRTYLEEGFIREDQKLNSMLVVLTMAISGGPFLGLLGTVWGVMNTFAAMAEAGEANIMAIAPGVASALSTTVFGLIVAIPALFGYNYLASKVKGITAEMDIFIEQFVLKMEEKYGETK